MLIRHPLLCVAFLLMLCGAACLRAEVQAAGADTEVMDPVVRAMCGKRIALLGEPPIHGFGKTLDFKVQLVRRLVEECHYNALFVESGIYDYLHIERQLRSGKGVPDAMIAASIGGLWANREVAALVPFLRKRVNAGNLKLGGLDDQIGAGTYASQEMPFDLVRSLPEDEKSRCLPILRRHMLWQYTQEAPYSPPDKAKLVGCLDELAAGLSHAEAGTGTAEESRAMIDSLQRNLARNFTEDDFTKKDQELRWVNDRDRSMYLNFTWLLARLPPHSKVIVWAATVHTAKNLSDVEDLGGRVPLGSYLERDFGRQAFSLGFSAYSGAYAFTHQPVQHLNDAPPLSLEGKVFARSGSDAVYLSRKQLRGYRFVAARPLGPDFETAHWDQVVDGLVVFREERAPAWINRQSR